MLMNRTKKIVSDNSPAILTAIGVTGSLTAVFLTGQAAFKASTIIRDEQYVMDQHAIDTGEKSHKLDVREQFDLTWKLYVPAAGIAALTIAAIIGSNHLSTRRAAALASAYSISEKAFSEYKGKVLEKFGEEKEQAVRDDIAKDRAKKNPPPPIVVVGKTCQVYDEYTGVYFTSSYDQLRQAEIDTNFQILHEGSATLSDFWRRLGATHAAIADEIGWNSDTKLDLSIGSTVTDDGVPILTLNFQTVPTRDYFQTH